MKSRSRQLFDLNIRAAETSRLAARQRAAFLADPPSTLGAAYDSVFHHFHPFEVPRATALTPTPISTCAASWLDLRSRVPISTLRTPRAELEPRYFTQARVPQALMSVDSFGLPVAVELLVFRRSPTDRSLSDWRANLIVKFNRPLGDLEFHVLFYDVHDGVPTLCRRSRHLRRRSQPANLRPTNPLRRPRYQPNRNMEGVITVRRQEVATFRFGIVGEESRRSGEVDFTGDDGDE